MGKFRFNELATSNLKIILTIVSSVTLLVSSWKTGNINDLFYSCTTNYASNALAFYAVNPKNLKATKRRARLINYYLVLFVVLFLCLNIYSSLSLKWIKISVEYIFRIVVAGSIFVAPIYALKDDDEYESKDVKQAKRNTQRALEERKDKKVFSSRDRSAKMNAETKEYIERNERKIDRERGG